PPPGHRAGRQGIDHGDFGATRMIEWVNMRELESRLRAYPPIGIRLQAFWHGRLAQDPSHLLARPAETHDEVGEGRMSVWSGFINGLPFGMRAQLARGRWGFEVAFPVRLAHDRLDVRTLLDA